MCCIFVFMYMHVCIILHLYIRMHTFLPGAGVVTVSFPGAGVVCAPDEVPLWFPIGAGVVPATVPPAAVVPAALPPVAVVPVAVVPAALPPVAVVPVAVVLLAAVVVVVVLVDPGVVDPSPPVVVPNAGDVPGAGVEPPIPEHVSLSGGHMSCSVTVLVAVSQLLTGTLKRKAWSFRSACTTSRLIWPSSSCLFVCMCVFV